MKADVLTQKLESIHMSEYVSVLESGLLVAFPIR
jgi:hypothetical protein